MTTERPYRGPLAPEQVQEELRRVADSQLDPGLVDLLLKVLRAEGFMEADSSTSQASGSQTASTSGSCRLGLQFPSVF